MNAANAPLSGDGHNGFCFETTHWSVVLRARDLDSPQSQQALERLCQVYWRPLYFYIRLNGYGVEDAQDLTQEFFCKFLEKKWVSHLTHQNGKFRSFMLTFLKHFLSDQRARDHAQKRGGGKQIISLDQMQEEECESTVPDGTITPEEAFDKRWAMASLQKALANLRREYETADKLQLYEKIKDCNPGTRGGQYAAIASKLGMTESAITSAVRRMRERYGQLIREEIANTVQNPSQIDEEIRYLMQVMGKG